MDIDLTDYAREAVSAILLARGIEAFEILVRAPLLGHPAGNEAILVRIPDEAPEIHIVRVPDIYPREAGDPEGILREAAELYRHAQRQTDELLRRYANERDRSAIEAVLGRLAAGEVDRGRAAEELGLNHWSDVLKLEREFGVQGRPRMISGEEDMMHDIDRMDAEDAVERKSGKVPTRDYSNIKSMRGYGWGDDKIKGYLHIDPSVSLPTPEEIDRYHEQLVYGIDRDAPMVGVSVTVAMGSKSAKIVVKGTDGEEVTKVAHPRWAGRNAGGYVDEALERLRLKGDLPPIPSW